MHVQAKKIENIQKTCLKIILGDNYVNYPAALEMCAFEELSVRRQKRCLSFAKKSLKYPIGSALFPENNQDNYKIKPHENVIILPP